jgi:hypothetical protein
MNASGKIRIVYGTAKKPTAPTANTRPGTATNVYAV